MHEPLAQTKRCQLCNNYDNSVIAGPIALKLRMHVGTPPDNVIPRVTVEALLDVRAFKGVYRSRERLNILLSNLV